MRDWKRTGLQLSTFFFIAQFFYFSLLVKAQSNSTPLVFSGQTLISGTAGSINAIYKFPNVTSGIDAHVTLAEISNGAAVSDVDIVGTTAGYEPAFQPGITIANGTSGTPKTSYVEWQIRFKKVGTSIDTVLANVSATAIDVDGSGNVQERVQAYTPSSYSVNSPNELTVTTDGVSVTTLAPTSNYNGIDSMNSGVMFQMNFTEVNLIRYRTGGVNRSSNVTRQFSIYFKAFFSQSTPLPVELIYFNANPTKTLSVEFEWATASETNSAYFTIERSIDANEYNEIVVIPAAGNSSHKNYYHSEDNDPMHGKVYYRLVQVDRDGYQKIYDPVLVHIEIEQVEFAIESVYPNPFRANAKIRVSALSDDHIKISLMDAQGVEKRSLVAQSSSGSETWNVDELGDLESGVYYLQASQNGVTSKTFRLMKN